MNSGINLTIKMMHRSLEDLDPEAANRGQVVHIQNIPRGATKDEVANVIENSRFCPEAVFWPTLDTVEPGNEWCRVQFNDEQDADRAKSALHGVSIAGSALQASIFRDTIASVTETETSVTSGNPDNSATQEPAVAVPLLKRPDGIGLGWGGWDKAINLQQEGKTVTLDMIEDKEWATVKDDIVFVPAGGGGGGGEKITIKHTSTFEDAESSVHPKTVRQFLEE